MTTILFRVDASAEIGTGHLMRCIALAQALSDEGATVAFLSKNLPDALLLRLDAERFKRLSLRSNAGTKEDAAETAEAAKKMKADWVVMDGYHFGVASQQAITDAGLKLFWIDDENHAGAVFGDVVVNQNLYADESLYPKRGKMTQLLLGPRYALLRREFTARQSAKIPTKKREILVTLGGADPDNVTMSVIEKLEPLIKDGTTMTIVAGAGNPHRAALEKKISSILGATLEVAVLDMTPLMAKADVAIAAAGTTTYELLAMGVPSVLLTLADNQEKNAIALGNSGAAVNLGWWNAMNHDLKSVVSDILNDEARRKTMSACGMELVDAEGASRVALLMTGSAFRLREAKESDSKLLWTWANDPNVRTNAFSTDAIPWETHEQWFAKKLSDKNSAIYLAIGPDDEPLGQIRFDRNGEEAEIDLHLAPGKGGKGLGTELIVRGTQKYFRSAPVQRVISTVKRENAASARAFEKAGFAQTEGKGPHASDCLFFVRSRA
jgi:UDP-2,4-diacetamido-2,4,6-trideoxy-beta-L-altropyranose hydrolase